MYRLTTTHADGSQTVTNHAEHLSATEAARRALDLGATGAAIVRTEPRGFIARVLKLLPTGAETEVLWRQDPTWTRDDAVLWARREAQRLRAETTLRYRPEVEVLR